MKIYLSVTRDIETGAILAEKSFKYEGPLELCDRSLNAKAKNAADTAKSVGAGYGSAASGIGGALIPGLEQEANNPTGYTPVEKSSQLVAGEQGAGGANAGITGEANLEAARTRNAGGFGGALDEAARIKGRQLSQNALGVENKSADLAQKKQQAAQGELGNLYTADTRAQLEAMGLIPKDIEAGAEANKTGWLQDFTDIMKSIQGAGASFKGGGGFSV